MAFFNMNFPVRFSKVAAFAAVLSLFFHPLKSQAYSQKDADLAFNAYTRIFYFTNANAGFFHATTDGGKTVFWDRAEQLEMLLDVYERTTNSQCLVMFSNVFNGFISDHGTNWANNDFNDDIMWMVIACARAHQLTGNPRYRDIARSNFDMCYARAWSTNLGGGFWWKTSNTSKNACVNGPASIAAYLLFKICDDKGYLEKSRLAYEWERSHLFDASSGQVYDNIDFNGEADQKSFTYNQGTFIAAANFLGHPEDAKRAADYVKNVLCHNGILPSYGQFGDAGGFNGIFVRWMAKFVRERKLQKDYQAWLQANADAAWSIRRPDDNLMWSRWSRPTPDGLLSSWACSCGVVILHVVPPTSPDSNDKSATARK